MLNSYYTVKPEGSKEIVVQKSRFIGHVKRCETEEEAHAFINEIKKKHKDATHNCSAYMIGEHDLIQKANDDGEPSGTAGVPMLDVLKKKGLKDTAVVVTRYFGGIKLGAGGLIRAYGSTVSLAIEATGVVERKLMKKMGVSIDYSLLGKVENEARQSKYILDTINYLERVELFLYTEHEDQEEFRNWITNITNGQAEIHEGESTYMEIDVPSDKQKE
ncbi:YigZ family protein [Salimicrobium sp. PL1-032A]|uniref:YigZ family protein n=1 Tax=Salimicrobium sp. PL1-032A TaxID=3095364 RepID=UPI003261BB3F